jgi:hypothetical protein
MFVYFNFQNIIVRGNNMKKAIYLQNSAILNVWTILFYPKSTTVAFIAFLLSPKALFRMWINGTASCADHF